MFFRFGEVKKTFQKNLKLLQCLNCFTHHGIVSEKTICYGWLQHGIKQKSIIFVVYDVEI